MVANVAEKGYEATTIVDLVELSGVSRSAFYKHFSDKQACFLAAIEALVGPALETASKTLLPEGEPPSDPQLTKNAFEGLIKRIAAQPAAATMCIVEVYAGGREAVALLDRVTDSLEALATPILDAMGREGMPSEMVRALIGGVQKVMHKRLYRGEPEQLVELAPQLWDWLLLYPPPPGPLRGPRRRVLRPLPFEERQAASNPSERLLRGLAAVVAEKGYPETTIADIIERAGTSYRAFYELFESKEDAVVAALDVGSLQMLAAALPAFRIAKDWPEAVQGHAGVDVPLRRAGARVRAAGGGRDVRGGQTGARAAREGDRTDGGAAGRRAMSSSPRSRRSPPRRSAGRSTRSSTSTSKRKGPSAWRSWCHGPSTSR